MNPHTAADLKRIYEARFAGTLDYRRRIWDILVSDFFQKHVSPGDTVVDLGSGCGEFINAIQCRKKFAMDLNPDAAMHLDPAVKVLAQDCASPWPLPDGSVNVVFTSNFFEHLPDKTTLGCTLDEIFRCLAAGGKLIAMGPNIKYLPGKYWDFWDHHLPLTEASLAEALTSRGFKIFECVARFLPYTMVGKRQQALFLLRLYLKLRVLWRIFGKQFLVIGSKTG